MAKIIRFPMSMEMVKRVNQIKSWERAYHAAEVWAESEKMYRESQKLKEDAEQFKLDIQKLFGKK